MVRFITLVSTWINLRRFIAVEFFLARQRKKKQPWFELKRQILNLQKIFGGKREFRWRLLELSLAGYNGVHLE